VIRELTEAELRAEGEMLGHSLPPRTLLAFEGELGAGKTTFIRGALRALGVTGPVTSPTFVVGVLYAEGRYAHLDLYRLDGLDAEDPGLLDPYFGPDVFTFVEWPERATDESELGGRAIAARVALAHAGGDRRTIEVRQ
jgi:tRNA threonylcarbamoyladenosine biosynthesis protein TsaE